MYAYNVPLRSKVLSQVNKFITRFPIPAIYFPNLLNIIVFMNL